MVADRIHAILKKGFRVKAMRIRLELAGQMTRRRLMVDAFFVLLAICLGLLWFFSLPKHRFTDAMLKRVRLGMTEEEVQAILGTPESLLHIDAPPTTLTSSDQPPKARRVRMQWYSLDDRDGGTIIVDFDKAGRVESARFLRLPLLDWIWRFFQK